MKRSLTNLYPFVAVALYLYAGALAAQHDHHPSHEPTAEAAPAPMAMSGRDASGTSWQPDVSPHGGAHVALGDWSVMAHGFAQLAYTDQGGPRGDDDVYLTNMFMLRGTRPLDRAALTLSGMFSLEPTTVGARGYPLLLQTGETADGVSHLIDAQHPHDFLMELSAKYRRELENGDAVSVYFGFPGEPALGPPAFMHRFSGVEFPDSPIGHHWLDATHITFGVLTAGYERGTAKFEVSSFTGREPDQHRYNFESPKFDSFSARASWNPTPNWSLQASGGRLHSPEQLEPDTDVTRFTASAIYGRDTRLGHWQVTGAWGQNDIDGGPRLDAWLLESAWRYQPRHTVLARAERADKNELEAHAHGAAEFHTVHRVSVGYIFDAWVSGHRALGLGAMATINFVPAALEHEYGARPKAVTVFLRFRF